MPEAVNARSGPKRVRKKSFALEGKNNARSRQCPKRAMPEAVHARSGPKRARKKSFAREGKNNVRSGDKIFRVYNNANGGGEDSLLAPLKGVFQYWCFNDELPLHFNSAKPLGCLQLRNFSLAEIVVVVELAVVEPVLVVVVVVVVIVKCVP